MPALKVPYPFVTGLPDRPRQEIYRNFEEIQRAFRSFSVDSSDDSSITFGVARIGTSGAHGTTYAEFSHATAWSGGPGVAGSYCLLQQNNGTTHLNTADLTTGLILVNNNIVASWNTLGINVHGNRGLNFTSHGGGWFMNESTWIRSVGGKSVWLDGGHFGTNGKLTIGAGGGTEFESINIQGGNTGISMISRTTSDRWVMYPYNSYFHFYDGSVDVLRIARGPTNDGRGAEGGWPASGGYFFRGVTSSSDASASHYNILSSGGSDQNLYLSPSWNTGGGRAVMFRDGLNGGNMMTIGVNNQGFGATWTIDMAVPALGGGNGMNVQAGASWQVGHIVSTGRFKSNQRRLRDTPDPDSGSESPIFKMRPTRFNWKQATRTNRGQWMRDGVANADELNAKFPDGVVGLIAEEVEQVCPDAVIRTGRKDPEPWDRDKHGLPWTDPDTGEDVTEVPGWEDEVSGIDTDRLIAYLIDAVQYLKEEIDETRRTNGNRPPVR